MGRLCLNVGCGLGHGMTRLFELLWGWQAGACERGSGGWPRGLTGGSSMTEPVSTLLMSRRTARAGAAVAVLALALTACGGGADDPDTGAPASTASASSEASPEPSASEDAKDSAAPSRSSTASQDAADGEFVPASSDGPAQNVPVPQMPTAAKEQTQEGLEAALEYWWEAERYLKLTGDPDPLRAISTEDCALCEELIKNWPAIYRADGWADIGETEMEVAFSSLDNNNLGGRAILMVSEAPGEVYRPDGSRVESASGDGSKDVGWGAGARYSGGQWQIEDMSVQ